MRQNTVKRNKDVRDYVEKMIIKASLADKSSFEEIVDKYNLEEILKRLIPIKVDGFRGVVLTAIAGMFIDKSFNPLTQFYDCNPRSIFEQGIWYALNDNNIPCAKSAPLNVAKNVNQLDDSWIDGKRPQAAAQAAVDFISILVEHKNTADYEKIVDYFFFELIKYAEKIRSIEVRQVKVDAELSKAMIADKLIGFTLSFPEHGTIPQVVVGKIIKLVLEKPGQTVEGVDESVFATNTTSKKPSDIWVADKAGPTNLFEITVKKIDHKRLDDCCDALEKLGLRDKAVIFICKLPDNIKDLNSENETYYEYKGMVFNFIDISEFIRVSISLLSEKQLNIYFEELTIFIEDVNRAKSTKDGWNDIF